MIEMKEERKKNVYSIYFLAQSSRDVVERVRLYAAFDPDEALYHFACSHASKACTCIIHVQEVRKGVVEE